MNRKTREVKQIGEANNEPDRILKTNRKGEIKTNRKGEAKVAIDDIEQGILEDGQNFKNDPNVFEVGGEGQPSKEGVEKFALQLSEYVGTEIGGAYFSKGDANKITHMTIGSYANNTYRSSKSNGIGAIRKISSTLEEYQSYNLKALFHTHPNESNRFTPSTADKNLRDGSLQQNPGLLFFIITHPDIGGEYPHVKDYTKY